VASISRRASNGGIVARVSSSDVAQAIVTRASVVIDAHGGVEDAGARDTSGGADVGVVGAGIGVVAGLDRRVALAGSGIAHRRMADVGGAVDQVVVAYTVNAGVVGADKVIITVDRGLWVASAGVRITGSGET